MFLFHHEHTQEMTWSKFDFVGPFWRSVPTTWFDELPRDFKDVNEKIWWHENSIDVNGRTLGPHL